MTPRYCLAVERRGPADYRALLFRGPQLITDANSYRPALAVRDAVEHLRRLRRSGWIAASQARATGGEL
jgi:hypothetical protein